MANNWLADIGNDKLLAVAMPSIERFLKPMIADAQAGARKLLLGPEPESLGEELEVAFLGRTVSDEDAAAIWEAVGRAVQRG